MLACEFREISKTFFTEHILATASGYSVKFYYYSYFFREGCKNMIKTFF